MPATPITPEEEQKVLASMGAQSMDDLFAGIPPKIRENANFTINVGEGRDPHKDNLSEHELRVFFGKLADKNAVAPRVQHFLGGGFYDNIIPAFVDQLVLRGEFLTCYTPYQPEVSQGTLQAVFEFQTMISRLTGAEVANASMYDGPTAAAEAILMAQRGTRTKKGNILLAASLPPDTREVIKTFTRQQTERVDEVPWKTDGSLDLEKLESLVKEQSPFAVVVGWPNYFGVVEDLAAIRKILPDSCFLIASVSDASALSIFEPPGRLGADIVVGEAHQLGTPMSFGGPHVGFFATSKAHMRQMPGRLVGETKDSRGQRCYSLTLATREQHIRRERATSNICTNQGLIALRTTMYLSFLGKKGFQQLGEQNFSLFDYLTRELEAVGIPRAFPDGFHYREGVFKVPNLADRFKNALARGIIPGIRMEEKFPDAEKDFSQCLLICAHPKQTKADIDRLVEVLSHD